MNGFLKTFVIFAILMFICGLLGLVAGYGWIAAVFFGLFIADLLIILPASKSSTDEYN